MKTAVVLGSFFLLCQPALADCVKYGPSEVTLTGIIKTRVDPGPPNYGEDPAHDSKEEHLYLHLDKAVCVDADTKGEGDAVASIGTMEMAYFVHQPFRREWLGKHVSVTGDLFPAISAHHWTKVLISPAETFVTRGRR